MNTRIKNSIIAGAAGLILLAFFNPLRSSEAPPAPRYEYATLRWDGDDDTHLILGDGSVEMLSSILVKHRRPGRANEEAFYMTIALNEMVNRGWELADADGSELYLRRPAAQ